MKKKIISGLVAVCVIVAAIFAYKFALGNSGTYVKDPSALKLVGDAGNVASNKFFKVSATITGEGSPNPDEILENACINFSIEVAPWNVVEQTEDDTN